MDNPHILLIAGVASLFLILSRFLSIFPILHRLKNGNRVSLITAINLSQISEFSLVIAALGVSAGHIGNDILSIIIFIFVITSIVSTYMIKFSDALQRNISKVLIKIGILDKVHQYEEDEKVQDKQIALLGFHRTASSLIHEILSLEKANDDGSSLKDKLVVVDFNPEIRKSLNEKGINVVYGDISHMDTLHHAGIHDVKIVISTIPDSILVGTDNLKIIKHIKEICPHAKIVVTAESVNSALKMYEKGADYVFMPRVLAAQNVIEMVQKMMRIDGEDLTDFIEKEKELLGNRIEVIS